MINSVVTKKILKHIDAILKYTKDVNYDDFMSNTMLLEACVFNLSQIGELVNKLDDEYIEKHKDIPWYKMRGLRNRIVHNYDGVKMVLIWEIIDSDIPNLKQNLQHILNHHRP